MLLCPLKGQPAGQDVTIIFFISFSVQHIRLLIYCFKIKTFDKEAVLFLLPTVSKTAMRSRALTT